MNSLAALAGHTVAYLGAGFLLALGLALTADAIHFYARGESLF